MKLLALGVPEEIWGEAACLTGVFSYGTSADMLLSYRRCIAEAMKA